MYSPQYDRLHQILQKYKPVEDPLIVIAEPVAPVEAPITDTVTPRGDTEAPKNYETSATIEVEEIPLREDVQDVDIESETRKLKGKIKEVGCHASFIKKLRGCLDQNGSTNQIQALQNQVREIPIQGNEFKSDNENEDLNKLDDQDWEDVDEFYTDNEVEDDDSIEKRSQDKYPEDVEDFQGHKEDEDEDVIEKENLNKRVKDDIQIYVEDLIHDILCFRNSSESEKLIQEENIQEDKEVENENASEQGKQDNDVENNVEDLIYDLLHFASNRTSSGSEITKTSIQGEDVQVANEVVDKDTTEQEKQYEYAKSVVENHDILISKLEWFLDQSTLHIEALQKKLPGSPKVEEEFEKENENVDVAEEEKENEYTEEQAEDHATFINKLRGFLDQIQALQNHVREIPIQGNEFEGDDEVEDEDLIDQEDQDWEDVEEFHTDNEIEDEISIEMENQDICTDSDVEEYQRDKENEDSYEQENQNRYTDDYVKDNDDNVIHDLLRFAANSSSSESEINEMSIQKDNKIAGKDTTKQEKKDSYTESVVENHDILLSKLKGFLDRSTPHIQTLQKQVPELPIAIPETDAKENKNVDDEKAIGEENEEKYPKEQVKSHTSFIRKLRGFLDQNGSTQKIQALQNQAREIKIQGKELQGDKEVEQENQNISSDVENVHDDNDVEDEDATDLRWFLDENNSIHHIRELQKQIRIKKENVQIDRKDVEEMKIEDKCTDDIDEHLMQYTDKDLPGEHRRNTEAEDDVNEDLVIDEDEEKEEDLLESKTQENDIEFEDDVDKDLVDDDNDDKKEDLPGTNAQADVEDEDKSVDLQGMKEKDAQNAEDDESVSLRSRLIFTRKLRWFLDQNNSSSDTRVLKKQTTRQILNDYIRDRNEH